MKALKWTATGLLQLGFCFPPCALNPDRSTIFQFHFKYEGPQEDLRDRTEFGDVIMTQEKSSWDWLIDQG